MVLVLSSMQLDVVIRLHGLVVLLGDSGLVNAVLLGHVLKVVNEHDVLPMSLFAGPRWLPGWESGDNDWLVTA